MARKFLTALDLSKNELQNAAVHNLPSAPAAPVKGQLYYNTTGGDDTLYWWNGTAWIAAKGAAAAVPATTVTTQAVGDAPVVGVATTFAREDHKHGREAFGSAVAIQTSFGLSAGIGVATTLARADHYHGTPAHTTADHATIPISGLAPATGPINMGGFVINNVGTPVAPTDAANKGYVDNAIAGLSWKDSVRATNTVNYPVATGGLGTQDGVTYLAGDRILLRGQTNQAENGIWIAALGAWTRATDADSAAEILGAAVYVEEGTTWGDTAWVMTTNAPITMGTTALVWSQFAGGGAVTAGAGMTQSGNTLNVIGDATMTVGADVLGVADDGISNAKLANMPALTVKGNNTLGSNNPSDLTASDMAGAFGMARKTLASTAAGTITVVNHGLNTQFVDITVIRSTAPFDHVECDVECTSSSATTVRFATAVTAGEYWILVVG